MIYERNNSICNIDSSDKMTISKDRKYTQSTTPSNKESQPVDQGQNACGIYASGSHIQIESEVIELE